MSEAPLPLVAAAAPTPGARRVAGSVAGEGARGLVVASLEPWGESQRRIRLLLAELLRADPSLSALYVEPPLDIVHSAQRGRLDWERRPGRVRRESHGGREVAVLRPVKALPRLAGPLADRMLEAQVLRAARTARVRRPLLWVNDANYAGLARRTGWPALYDVTDDWLMASMTGRERARLADRDRWLVTHAAAVVVCSEQLRRSKGEGREVAVIPNGVDVELFRRPAPRPADLPPGRVLLYAGALHDDRLDVELCEQLASTRPDVALVLLGPDSLRPPSRQRLASHPNVHLLGARPYAAVPAYLQHAEIVVIPHKLTPFTESLDPIKAYECLAVGRPTVSTPVAGVRQLGPPLRAVDPASFVAEVGALLDAGPMPSRPVDVATWAERARAFDAVLAAVGAQHQEATPCA